MLHNYWACALEPQSCNCWAQAPQLLTSAYFRACVLRQEKPPQWEAQASWLHNSSHLLQLEKNPHSNEDPEQPNKTVLFKKEQTVNITMFTVALDQVTSDFFFFFTILGIIYPPRSHMRMASHCLFNIFNVFSPAYRIFKNWKIECNYYSFKVNHF